MNDVDEALLAAAWLEADENVLVLGAGTLALAAQKRLGDGWVYVVRHEVDELEALLGEAHAADAPGLAYLVGEPPVLPLPDHAVAAAVGRVPWDDETSAFVAAELARVVAAGGRVALSVSGRAAGAPLAAALETAGFDAITLTDVGDEVVVAGTRK